MQYPMIAQPQYAFAPTMMAKGGAVDAENVRSQGRGKDSMLVHMTPNEVAGLQALAMRHGGSLTINPKTGLPEAGFLENLLPALAGAALVIGSGGTIDPMTAGMIVGGGTTVATGDINQGLMAGFGAYGGASLGAAAGPTPTPTPTPTPGVTTTPTPTPTAAPALTTGTTSTGLPTVTVPGSGDISLASSFTGPGSTAAQPTFMQRFSQAAASGGQPSAIKTGLAATGLVMPFAETAKPLETPTESSNYAGPYKPTKRNVSYPGTDERRRTSEFTYFSPSNPVPFAEGGEASSSASNEAAPDVLVSPNEAKVYQDIINVQRLAGLPSLDPNRFAVAPGRSYEQYVYNPIEGAGVPALGTGEKDYGIKPLMSEEEVKAALAKEGFVQSIGRAISDNTSSLFFNKGGSVPQLEDGGFVLTKKAVDGLGRGSNKKGQKVASRGLGAVPIKGPGTGTSDSIKTNIDGKRPALISNGEAYVPKRQVAKRGGAKAFYALMNKAEKAADRRKRA